MTTTHQHPVLNGTVAAACAVAAAAVTAVLTLADAARERDGVARIDPRIAADVLHRRDAPLTDLAHALTFAGSEAVVGGLALIIVATLVVRRHVVPALTLALAMAGSVVLTVVVKQFVMRSRPGPVDVLGPVDHSYSFPSGHTLNSAVLIAVSAYLLARQVRRPLGRVLVAAAGVALATGIGLSRIYLGYHWATDVLASWLVALAWLMVVYLVMSALGTGAERRISPHLDRILRR